jgi:hypothetical protein
MSKVSKCKELEIDISRDVEIVDINLPFISGALGTCKKG